MALDIRTLSVVVAVANVLQTIVIAFLYIKNKKYPGILWWALGSSTTAIGFILFLARDVTQDALIAIILPNALTIAGSLLIYIGIMRFFGKEENKGLVFSVFALFIILYFYYTYVIDDVNTRTIIISVAFIFYLFLIIQVLVGKIPKAITASSHFIAVILFLEACFFVFRTYSVLTFAPVASLFTPTLIQTMTFGVYFVDGILLTFGLIFMVNQRLNAEVMDAKDHFEIIFNTNPDGVIISRLDNGIIVDVNDGITNLTGFNRSDIIGCSIYDTRFWKNPDDIQAVVNEFRRKKHFENIEIMLQQKSGSGIACIASARIISLQAVPHILSVIRDITERKKAEQSLQTERDFASSILSTIGGLIIVLDREGRIVRFNRSCEIVTGYSFEEVKGKQFWDLFILPEELQGVKDTFAQLTSGMFPNQHENFWLAKDGTRRFIQWSNSAMTGADGSVTFVLGTGIDITERKRAEESLKEALSEKEVLLSEIHHRVKNNLTAFISLLSLDGSYEDTESGRTLRKDLQNRARSMALIHETLYRTGKFSNVDMSIYLKNLVDQIAQSYGTRSDIKISVDVDGTLSIDRATTAGLIINELVTNSFKYAFPPEFDCIAVRGVPCTILVSLAREDGTDVLRVSDNGCGFRVGFDPHTSKSLGLKLVNFLSRHQLMADVEIRSDKGTEFIFRLKNTENNP
jgi:PAS domain S-box-containing protein